MAVLCACVMLLPRSADGSDPTTSLGLGLQPIPTLPCGFALVDVAGQKVPFIFPCPLDGQPMSGTWVKPFAASDADTTACRGCSFTAGKDIKSTFKADFTSGFQDPGHAAFVSALPTWDQQGGLRQQYSDIVAAVSGKLPANPADPLLERLEDVRTVLQPFAELAGTTIPAPQAGASARWVRAFAPIHGRHLVRELRLPAQLPPAQGWIEHNYPDPQCFAELRWRGARSYCAMREAAFAAGGAKLSLGQWSIGDALFWTFGAVEPSLRFEPPVKELDAPSAQAFGIPLRIGGNLTPARGPVLPDFGELTHPLVWLTADAEVFDDEDFGSYFTAPTECRLGAVCPPNHQIGFRKTARNIKHVDVLAGTSASATLEVPDVLVATFGPASLFLSGNISIESGVLDTNLMAGGAVVDPSAPDPWPPTAWPTPRDDKLDVLGVPGPEASDAPLRRVLSGAQLLRPVENGQTAAAWTILMESPAGTPVAFGTALRWRNDDDRSVAMRDRITEAMSLAGKLGFSLGPVHATLSGSTTFTAMSEQTLAFREHLSAVDPPLLGIALPPRLRLTQANAILVAEPHSELSYEPLTVTLHLELRVDLGFKTISVGWEQELLKLEKVPLGGVTAQPAEEGDRLRVGAFSEIGLAAFDGGHEKPAAFSHLPGNLSFTSFPQTVAECLADPEQPVDPTDDDPVTPGDPPIHGELCAVGIQAQSGQLENLGPVPANVCDGGGAIQAYAAGYACSLADEICGPRRQCLVDALSFLCSPTSKVQPWFKPPQTAVAHVLTDAEHATIGTIVQQCIVAFAIGESDPESAAKAFPDDFIDFVPCDANGTIGVPLP